MFAGGAVLIPLWFVQGLTDDRFTPSFSQSYFWIALGVLIGCGGLYRDKKRAQEKQSGIKNNKKKTKVIAKPWVYDPFEEDQKGVAPK